MNTFPSLRFDFSHRQMADYPARLAMRAVPRDIVRALGVVRTLVAWIEDNDIRVQATLEMIECIEIEGGGESGPCVKVSRVSVRPHWATLEDKVFH